MFTWYNVSKKFFRKTRKTPKMAKQNQGNIKSEEEPENFLSMSGHEEESTTGDQTTSSSTWSNERILLSNSSETDPGSSSNAREVTYDETCPDHGDKLSFYCDEHTCFICGTCKVLSHAHCVRFTYIPRVTDEVFECEELKKVEEDIGEVKDTVRETVTFTEDAKNRCDRLEEKAIDRVTGLRHQMNELFNEIEHNLLEQISEIKSDDIARNASILDQSNTVLHEACSHEDRMNKLIKSRDPQALYRHMKRTDHRMQQLKDEMSELRRSVSVRGYGVRTSNFENSLKSALEVSMFLKDDEEMDTQVDICPTTDGNHDGETYLPYQDGHFGTSEENSASSCDASNSGRDPHSSLLESINLEPCELGARRPVEIVKARAMSEIGQGCITDLLILDNGNLVIIENGHAKIKYLVCVKKKWQEHGKLTLDSAPWSGTKLDGDSQRIAVTLPEDNGFSILSVDENIKVEAAFNVGTQCRGIAYNSVDKTLVISSLGSDMFRTFDLTGRLMSIIGMPNNFTNPSYLALSPDGKKLFAADLHRGTVSRVDIPSKTVDARFVGGGTCRPFGMELVDNNLYVCDFGTHHLLRLDAFGDMQRVCRYRNEDWALRCQSAVAVCTKTRRIFIAKDNYVNIFSM